MFRKPFELWNSRTNQSIKAKKLDDVLDKVIEGKTIKEHIEALEHIVLPPLDGGNGRKSNDRTFKFSHARNEPDHIKSILPAYANTRIKTKTLESAMQEFRNKHKDLKDREWAYEVDDQGFVHQYKRGNPNSIAIGSSGRNTIILHNHPDGGAFSDADLISTSMDRRSKGIVASGKKADYVFQKGGHFKANNFIKAVKTAKITGKDHDSAVDKWLKKNQKKYGYTYYKTSNHLKK